MLFTVAEIVAATGGTLSGEAAGGVTAVSTDSRTVAPGELFVALKGERFDGHAFIGAAAGRGVTCFLVEAEWLRHGEQPAGTVCIAVADTLRALGDLAALHRRRFAIQIVGITGSNGKTTTKEMLASILSLGGPGLKTAGNLNNLIGLPQMLLQLTGDHKWAVLEMGMSEPGEIDRLAEIAGPQVGIITNAFPAHLATMGSVEAVAAAKGELFRRLPAGGTAVFNMDDPLIAAQPTPAGVNRLGFGTHGADISASAIAGLGKRGLSFRLRIGASEETVRLHAFGQHNIYNALAAAGAAHALGISLAQIVSGLASFRPYDKRFKLDDLGAIVLIDDSYNANPASMAAALLTIRDIKEESRAIAVLGDMLELGEETLAAHRSVGRLAATCVDRLYLYGAMAAATAEGATEAGMDPEEIVVARSHEEIVADIVKDHVDGDCIVVKGSRGMRMDAVATALYKNYGAKGHEGEGR
jgi:UDP-N-acetylmuramoyl-tripeptide--D-alanyl-D-alanine ligase